METDNIKHSLGKIEGKVEGLCQSVIRLHQKLDNLPCEAHLLQSQLQNEKNVPWKVFIVGISALFVLISSAYTFTYLTSKKVNGLEIRQNKLESVINEAEMNSTFYGVATDDKRLQSRSEY